MRSLFPEKVHRIFYLSCLIGLALGLPLSKFLMSLSQIVMICNWVLEGKLKQKMKLFLGNKVALIVSSVLVLHFVGMLYTTDYSYAFKDIRIKLPIMLLPLVISTSEPLNKKMVAIVLKLFVGSVLIGTIISMLVLFGVIPHKVNDIRDVSIFISHIRFALLICMAVFILIQNALNSNSLINKALFLLIILWFSLFLVIIESLTGIVALTLTLFVLACIYILKQDNKWLKFVAFVTITVAFIIGVFYLKSIADENKPKEHFNFNKLDKYTSRGNLYSHDTLSEVRENGHLIWMYYNTGELREAWKNRSSKNIDTVGPHGNIIYFTLFRFLASKGLRKDADAVYSLNNDEIKAVENGITNVNYQNISSLRGRIYETLWEIDLYTKTGQASGHSLTQRFEYWKNALSIIKSHLLFGVGTGDVAKAFDEEYVRNNSSLDPRWRLRSHNQYLSIAVAFGIVGLVWFLITLIYPLVTQGKNNYLYIAFFILATISFFTEDTLETQAGVTFFAFFNTFLLFASEKTTQTAILSDAI